ncbi:hypothetical protein CCAX7_20920 [Capsulimonas corticalis]|uniref:Uncharacterized protein n=1 Tax=Capsulimonas corticalis TaxID=2219043 RepID=A0A402D290_9BACT|nr:TlpA disulfide reductase family protein [Capsulimonas corticalis]BDI30041.1 hypothetical protein CCAX7_20920 [Capsulimonas corticalis]
MNRSLRALLPALALTLLAVAPTLAKRDEMPPLPAGVLAPDFTVAGWTGAKVHLADYRGKIVVLDFWASWCPPCNAAMPHLQSILDQYKSDIVVLALCVQDSPDDASKWIRSHPYTFNYALDTSGDSDKYSPIMDDYHVWGIPTTYIIDQNGSIADGHVTMSEQEIVTAIRALGAQTETERVKPERLSALRSSLQDGERAFTGVITGKSDDNLTLQMDATAILHPTGEVEEFDKPRKKKILITKTTRLQTGKTDATQTSIDIGAHVNVIGVDHGVGKSFTARVVMIYK